MECCLAELRNPKGTGQLKWGVVLIVQFDYTLFLAIAIKQKLHIGVLSRLKQYSLYLVLWKYKLNGWKVEGIVHGFPRCQLTDSSHSPHLHIVTLLKVSWYLAPDISVSLLCLCMFVYYTLKAF